MKYFFKNGSWLVLLIVALGVIGSGLTVWNYKQNVFSTREAQVTTSDGMIEALFPRGLKIVPHQVARVTFQQETRIAPSKAEVVSVVQTKQQLLVTLRLIDLHHENQLESDKIRFGTPCSVTIDATIPQGQ